MVKTEVLVCHVALKSSHNAGFHGETPFLIGTVNTHSAPLHPPLLASLTALSLQGSGLEHVVRQST